MGESVKDKVSGQALGLRQMFAKSATRVVAVTGGSKGVGRTAAVVNLAMALTRQGMDVLVVDECPGARSASTMLRDIHAAGVFAPAIHRNLPRVLAVDRGRRQFHSTGTGHTDHENFAGLQYDAVLTSPPNIVLIDAALAGNGAFSPLALQAHHVIVVMHMSAAAVADTYVCMKRLRLAQGIEEFRIIVNLFDGEADTHALLESLGAIARDYLAVSVLKAGCISIDPCIAQAAELSRCVVDAFPGSPAASDFARVAADMQSWSRRPAASWLLPATTHMAARGQRTHRTLGPAAAYR
ncbi:flagellar biosynthesis protein FlhG [Paraburkholderia sp. MM5482-R2]|uniref:MinD/ParA family ATP-binding protein n=2 Tax=unclassified Paraburkholderia TaxID=2615204 RepID=UPI003D219E6C